MSRNGTGRDTGRDDTGRGDTGRGDTGRGDTGRGTDPAAGAPLAGMRPTELIGEVQDRLAAMARSQACVQQLLDAFLAVSSGVGTHPSSVGFPGDTRRCAPR